MLIHALVDGQRGTLLEPSQVYHVISDKCYRLYSKNPLVSTLDIQLLAKSLNTISHFSRFTT